ncbi:MAG: SBBP repeat-containing protein [Chloroflexaceae bacterium]
MQPPFLFRTLPPLLLGLLLLTLAAPIALRSAAPPAATSPQTTTALPDKAVLFIENAGQFNEEARFQVRSGDRTFWLADDAIWMTLLSPLSSGAEPGGDARHPRQGINLRLSFPGANPHPRLEPFDRLETSVNYFLGNDPAQWRANVPVYAGVRYVDLYPGVDLEWRSDGGRLTPRLVCRADCQFALRAVRLQVDGAEAVSLLPPPTLGEGWGGGLLPSPAESGAGGEGTLPFPSGSRVGGEGILLTTALGQFTLPLFQVVTADGAPVAGVGGGAAVAGNQVRAPFAADLRPAPLAAPQGAADLLYATFLGGSSGDFGDAIAVDASGAAYVTGTTESSNFPTTPGAFDTMHNGNDDAFVVKLNPAGAALLYATFLGGGGDDGGHAIAVDASGAAYVTGYTESSNFPTTTPGAFDTTYNGNTDAFVVKLNPAGSALAYATFLGGSDSDFGDAIAVDASGAAYVMGRTGSANFPTTAGAFDTTHNGNTDSFVVKLNPYGTTLAYATFLGGSFWDISEAIAVDASGAVYVAGETWSSDFPTTAGAFDTTYNGNFDAFVVQLNPDGAALTYATFLGGIYADLGSGIAVDASGAAYVTGMTFSADFPTTPGAFDTMHNGNGDAFVVQLSSTGAALTYATVLGGSDQERGNAIAVDASGATYVAGTTRSANFPTTAGAFDTALDGNLDAFVVKLNPDGATLAYATFLGGSNDDFGDAIAVDASGAAYVMGRTLSADFPTTPGAFDTTYNGNGDAFVVKLTMAGGGGPTPTATPAPPPTSTPTATPTPPPTSTPTATPIPTSTPTATPIPTATPTPDNYRLYLPRIMQPLPAPGNTPTPLPAPTSTPTALPLPTATSVAPSPTQQPVPRLPDDWLERVNWYRQRAGVPPVSQDATLNDNCWQHARYMAENDDLTHNQNPSLPYASPAGQICAQMGNAWMGPSGWQPRDAVDGWMSSIGHRLWLLYPTTPTFGFGFYQNAQRAAAGLDVLSRARLLSDNATYAGWPVRYPAPGQTDVPATAITLLWPYFDQKPVLSSVTLRALPGTPIAHTATTDLPVNHKGIAIIPDQALPANATIEVTVTGTYKGQPFSYTWHFQTQGG